jgi:3-isopropylmalate dehydrogenase
MLISALADDYGLSLEMESALVGGAAIDEKGDPLPAKTLDTCRRSDAIILGAVGGPKWSDPNALVRPEQGLLKLRKELGLYANLRPVRVHPKLFAASPLKPEYLDGVDLVVVRELTGGSYFGEKVEGDKFAMDSCTYTREEVERVVVRAAHLARSRSGRLTMIDKANVMATSRLWRKVTVEIMESQFPDVKCDYLLVDAAAMFLMSKPASFDVIVTENMFGDILTDEASMLVGSMGMLPSASLGSGSFGLYEPIHGSAPDIAGKGIANPLGMLASVAMMFEHSLDMVEAARRIESAIHQCISSNECTPDLGGNLSTGQAGAAVRSRLDGYIPTGVAHG